MAGLRRTIVDRTLQTRRAAPSRSRVWIALFACPAILAVAFLPVAAYFALTRGLEGEALFKAIEPIAAVPSSLAFLAVFLVTRWLAAKDGIALPALGWLPPSAADVVVGLLAGALLWGINAAALYPLLQDAQPSFDPTLANVPLLAALVMMGLAVLSEDTLYRGYALRVLGDRHGALVAVVLTTLLYALLTPSPAMPLRLWAAYFGLVLCALKLWRRSLWPVALAHLVVTLGPKLLHDLSA